MALKAKWEKHHATVGEWFWGNVDKSDNPNACWPWKGRKLKAGYGRLVLDGRHVGAHRVALAERVKDGGLARFVAAWRELRRVQRVAKAISLTVRAAALLRNDMLPGTRRSFLILGEALDNEMLKNDAPRSRERQ